ncbi:MAG TPA: FtsX-like permease family protein [Gaiellaceae bacterium]|nr:FtsX-like permease family protein [Gaiellaceae bacterium]
MIRVALKGLLGRKLRAALTVVAIVLGVAMISGTYVLTDTIKSAFSTVFTTVYSHTDAVISAKSAIGGNQNGNNAERLPAFPESLLAKVRALPGVAAAEGGVDDTAHLVGRDGKVISGHGAPGLAFSVHAKASQRFNPLTLVSGTWPMGPDQVAIDANTASKSHYKVGDSIGVIALGPVQQFRISGIVKIGGVSSLSGATMAIFDFPTAQLLFHKVGKLDGIDVAGKPGIKPAELVREIAPILPPTAQVRTAQAQAQQATKDTNGFLSIFNDFLLAFAGVALFVGSFVIANTLSITIAQRTRELATLRTLGAYRRQVLVSVMLEAFVIGALAALVGLFAGLGLAKGLNHLFVSFGIDLPQAGTVFATRTIVVALSVGIVVTLLAALRPAIRATRVPPVSAVREGAVLPESRFARFSAHAALLTIGGAVALMLVGLFVGGISTVDRLLAIGIGAAAMFVGVAMLAKTLVPPLAQGSHPVATWATVLLTILFYPELLSFWLLRYGAFTRTASVPRRVAAFALGAINLPALVIVLAMVARRAVTSFEPEWPVEVPTIVPDWTSNRLARANAMRNPQRTASAASALMIGLALVTLVSVLAAGLKSTFENSVNSLFSADYALTATDNFSPISIASAKALARVPGVTTVSGVRAGQGKAFGKRIPVTGVAPDISKVITVDWQAGSQSVPAELGRNGAFVSKDYAKKHHLLVGSTLRIETPTGKTLNLDVRGIYAPPKGGSPYGDVTISAQRFDAEYANPQNVYTFVNVAGGDTPANTAKLTNALKSFPDAKIATESQFKKNQEQGINMLLNLLYVLLSLSIIISLFGIVNTLVLTVFERTRELGMLRAVGMTRRQVRRMIRHESIVTALIGAALGIPVGVVLAWMVGRAIKYPAFTIPVWTLVVFVIAAIVAGIVAAIFPARRAGRLNVLEALSYE